MTMNISQIGGTESNHIPLGATLQNAREAQRLERKDAAAQLRLNESVIDMIENNSFPETMPQIFIRGYIRAYGKLLQVPEDMIAAGLEPVKPRVVAQEAQLAMPVTQTEPRRNRKGFAMKGITIAVAVTLLWLMASWWNSRATAPAIDNVAITLPTDNNAANSETTTPASIDTTETISNAPQANAAATMAPAVAVTPNLNTKAVANQFPAGISIAQPLQHLSQSTPAYTPSAGAMTEAPVVIAGAKSEAAPTAEKTSPAPASIPAYKRAAMASENSQKTETVRNNSDE